MGIITKLNISQSCDFGSQMTQYAALRSISEKTGLEVAFISEYLNRGYQYSLNVPFKMSPNVVSLSEVNNLERFVNVTIDETKIVDDNLFNLNPNLNYNIVEGLFHLYSNFHPIKEKIIELFDFKDEIKKFCLEYISKIKKQDEILVSIHFRRGDYVGSSFFVNLSLEYYRESIDIIKSSFPDVKFKYLVFSNGIDWVKENFKIENCIYVEGLDRFKDMCLMSLCDHNIIANSTFSWWGAYLNKNLNKKVICPYDYASRDHMINGKYFPLEWTAIKTY